MLPRISRSEENGASQSVYLRIKGAKLFTQESGQHWVDLVHEIRRSASFRCFLVQLRSLLHEIAHVCNMHTNFIDVLSDLLNRQGIVQISGGDGVYREYSLCSQVQSLVYFSLGYGSLFTERIDSKHLEALVYIICRLHVFSFVRLITDIIHP